MIIKRKYFSKDLNTIKSSVIKTIQDSNDKPNRAIAKESKNTAKDYYKSTGKTSNSFIGDNGKEYTTKYYKRTKKKRSKQKDTQLPIPFDNISEVKKPKTKKKDNVVNPMIRNEEVDYSPETGEKRTDLFTDGKSKKFITGQLRFNFKN